MGNPNNKLEEQNIATLAELFSLYKPKTKQNESDTNYNIAYASITSTGRIYVSKETLQGDYQLAFNIIDGIPVRVLLGNPGLLHAEKPVRIENSNAPDYIKEIVQNAYETAKGRCKEKNKKEISGKNYVRTNMNKSKQEIPRKGLTARIIRWMRRE